MYSQWLKHKLTSETHYWLSTPSLQCEVWMNESCRSLLISTSAVIRRWDRTNRRINVASVREIIHTAEPSNSRSTKPRRRQVQTHTFRRAWRNHLSLFTSIFLFGLKNTRLGTNTSHIHISLSLSSCSAPAERKCEVQRVLFYHSKTKSYYLCTL